MYLFEKKNVVLFYIRFGFCKIFLLIFLDFSEIIVYGGVSWKLFF